MQSTSQPFDLTVGHILLSTEQLFQLFKLTGVQGVQVEEIYDLQKPIEG